jgi:peptidoglycan/xylan/chitin deacetylase (PgdA/CDA1 family)
METSGRQNKNLAPQESCFGRRRRNQASSRYSTTLLILILVIVVAGIVYLQTHYAPKPVTAPSIQSLTENRQPTVPLLSVSTTTIEAQTDREITTAVPTYNLPEGEVSRGNPNKKQIIFTFDCGAGTSSADKVLEAAIEHNLKLTFFTTGKFAEQNPEVIKKFAAAGHEVFNHTYSHPHLTQISEDQVKEELTKADEIISGLTGTTTKPFFRPPYGNRDKHVLEIASILGFQSVYWTTDALDWETGRTNEQTKERIYSSLKNGGIILMHVGDDITGNILEEVFTYIEGQGYKIVSLTEGLK